MGRTQKASGAASLSLMIAPGAGLWRHATAHVIYPQDSGTSYHESASVIMVDALKDITLLFNNSSELGKLIIGTVNN